MGTNTRQLGNLQFEKLNSKVVEWQSTVTSDGSTVTQTVAGRGYFIDNSSAAGIVKLPAVDDSNTGDTIMLKDYAGNFGTNNLTIQRNGHNIQGLTVDATVQTDRASVTLVYVDSTKGWLFTMESNVAVLGPTYISATGGTVATSGNFKIHSFTGDGCFVVSCAGNSSGSNKVSYIVVAGGGGGGRDRSGGGGAGGYREGRAPAFDSYTASPLVAPDGLPVSAQTYPITVGAGGAGGNTSPNFNGANGSNSSFSTITSAGGGGGMTSNTTSPQGGGFDGGSGGGGAGSNPSPHSPPAGIGNTPPVSPPQGNPGGEGQDGGNSRGAGGGGATAAAVNASTTPSAAPGGGAGATSCITGSPVARAGGGGGTGTSPRTQGAGGSGGGGAGGHPAGTAGTANTGGGGGGSCSSGVGAAGGKGVVIIRYKFQGS